jgi:hypothetical protein
MRVLELPNHFFKEFLDCPSRQAGQGYNVPDRRPRTAVDLRLAAWLRPGTAHAGLGAADLLARIVPALQAG